MPRQSDLCVPWWNVQWKQTKTIRPWCDHDLHRLDFQVADQPLASGRRTWRMWKISASLAWRYLSQSGPLWFDILADSHWLASDLDLFCSAKKTSLKEDSGVRGCPPSAMLEKALPSDVRGGEETEKSQAKSTTNPKLTTIEIPSCSIRIWARKCTSKLQLTLTLWRARFVQFELQKPPHKVESVVRKSRLSGGWALLAGYNIPNAHVSFSCKCTRIISAIGQSYVYNYMNMKFYLWPLKGETRHDSRSAHDNEQSSYLNLYRHLRLTKYLQAYIA